MTGGGLWPPRDPAMRCAEALTAGMPRLPSTVCEIAGLCATVGLSVAARLSVADDEEVERAATCIAPAPPWAASPVADGSSAEESVWLIEISCSRPILFMFNKVDLMQLVGIRIRSWILVLHLCHQQCKKIIGGNCRPHPTSCRLNYAIRCPLPSHPAMFLLLQRGCAVLWSFPLLLLC